MPPDPTSSDERQCAALPYRRRGGVLEVLLVTRRSRPEWIVPKGGLEPGHSEAESAEVEAREEAGVSGRIVGDCVGTFQYRKGDRLRTVALYDLEVVKELDDWPEQGQRQRRWLPAEEAAAAVNSPDLAGLIRGLTQRIPSGRSEGHSAQG